VWTREAGLLLRAGRGPSDFMRMMQSRLSLSRVGPLVAPHPLTARINLRQLGKAVHLRSHTSDISVLGELLEGSYTHLPPAGTSVKAVVDLGSNSGLAFRWLHTRYPEAQFVCVEPDPGNADVLRKNVAASGAARATVLEACAGGRRRRVSLVTDHGEFAFRMVDDEEQEGDIDVLTVPDILEQGEMPESIDVMKCDIEGAEDELFQDCREWIQRVEWLVVECHHPYTADRLEQVLRENGASPARVHIDRNDDFGCETVTLKLARHA
jgi:FkbM family methyltransferase